MSDSIVRFAPPVTVAQTRSSLVTSLALVVGFWWAATGLTLAMQWSSAASTVSVAVTSLLAVVGGWLVLKSRHDATVSGARTAFLGSALVWWWCSALFYDGVGVSIATPASAPSGSAALAAQAIAATLRVDLVGVLALIAIGVCVRKTANKVAFWALAVFFGTLQTAKLNVFFGVRNSGVDWLPSHLAGLVQFFGPSRNSPLLPVTVLLLSLVAIAFGRRAMWTRDSFVRHANAMLAFLVTLAVVEHVFLGVPFTLPLWNAFLVRN